MRYNKIIRDDQTGHPKTNINNQIKEVTTMTTKSTFSSPFFSPFIKVRDRVVGLDEPDNPGTVVGFKKDREGRTLVRVQWDDSGAPEGELYPNELVKR
jgi:hypothetical protein